MPASVLRKQAAAQPTPPAATLAEVTQPSLTTWRQGHPRQRGSGALSLAQDVLLDPALNPRLPYNLDAWDGYPASAKPS